MNRIAKAWKSGGLTKPATCPICSLPVGFSQPVGSDKNPLIVQRITDDRVMEEVMLHASCQARCSQEELDEIRPPKSLAPNIGEISPGDQNVPAAREKFITLRLFEAMNPIASVDLTSISGGQFFGKLELMNQAKSHWKLGPLVFCVSDVIEVWRNDDGDYTITTR